MSLQINDMQEADFDGLMSILYRAYFSRTGLGGLLWNEDPSPASLAQIKNARVRAFRTDATARHIKATDPASGGALVACAKWHLYTAPRTPEQVAESVAIARDEIVPELNEPVHVALLQPLRDAHREIMQGRPHVFLNTLVADPERGRQGAGGLLLRWGLERADELGLPTYLDATPMGKGLYEKNGFEVVRTVPFDLADWGAEGVVEHVCMVRQPGASSMGGAAAE